MPLDLLKPGVSADDLDQKLPDFAKRHLGKEAVQNKSYKLLPLTKLHLYGRQYNQDATGDIHTCYTLGLIGIFIVVIACINFMNLSTARSARRMREVGMRKVVGAKRSQLVYQFLGESILLSILSLILSTGLTELTLPMLNGFLGVQLSLQATILPILLAIAITVGALSGSYPAFFLSSFRPTATLTLTRNTQGGHAMVRRGLVTVQFAISIVLMSATAIMFQQFSPSDNHIVQFIQICRPKYIKVLCRQPILHHLEIVVVKFLGQKLFHPEIFCFPFAGSNLFCTRFQ
ncbi:MAG: FtsX-like permease family protein, partial [Candidatus Latescibacteria bacterium]|nr:FtsX-like permease family protein [Candidatus Latescibacterota bacterium]